MIYQLLSSIVIQLLSLEAVGLPQHILHLGHLGEIGAYHTALVSDVSSDRPVISKDVRLAVELATPSAQDSSKMVEPVETISGSGVAVIGGIAPSGENVSQNTANDSSNNTSTNDLRNYQPSGWHNLLWGVAFVLLFIAASSFGGLIGYLLGEMCRKSKLLGWMYVVSEPNYWMADSFVEYVICAMGDSFVGYQRDCRFMSIAFGAKERHRQLNCRM
jgi:hypothetical protein